MFVKALLLLSIFHFTKAGVWFHVGQACIGAKNNAYDEMVYGGPSSFVGAVKLIHTKGYVSNNRRPKSSYWGSNTGTPLATLITDNRNRLLYPSPRVTTVSSGGWYTLPGYAGTSPNLVFSDFCAPQYFEKDRKLRVWYGEDWSGHTEADNHGKSCMQVYLYLMGH